MLTNIVVHVMFQLTLAFLIFWLVLIPICKETAKFSVKASIDSTFTQSPQTKINFPENIKKEVFDYLSNPDMDAYIKNSRVLLISSLVTFGLIIIGFIILLIVRCNVNISPYLIELLVTYSVVVVIQLVFVKFVVQYYIPATNSDTIGFAVDALNKKCK